MALFMLFAVFMLVSSIAQADDKCPRCHGSGRQLTIPDTGHYGVERHKRQCPVCGQMVFAGHRDKCTVCDGTGRIAGRRSSGGGNAFDVQDAAAMEFYMRNLTSAEYSLMQDLISSLFFQRFVVDTCNACKGSKHCPLCGGVQNFSLDVDMSTLCRMCGGGGLCIRCNGQGNLGSRYEFIYSPSERRQISSNIGVINHLAQLRNQYRIAPGQKGGPYLDIDRNGNYFIQNKPTNRR